MCHQQLLILISLFLWSPSLVLFVSVADEVCIPSFYFSILLTQRQKNAEMLSVLYECVFIGLPFS
jgi:hypothetical protein